MFSTSKFLVNPPSTVTTDPYFRYTTLLLNDTGTNGAQNNTFIDSSTNNFTITRNGNTTQGSFNPYMPTGYWGGYLDGNGDYLTTSSSTSTTGDFTVEAWIYMTSTPTFNMLLGPTSGTNYFAICPTKIELGIGTNYPSWNYTFSANQWYHVAIARQSGLIRCFVNGTQLTLSAYSASDTQTYLSGALYIGRYNAGTPWYFNGYISNLRIVTGTAVYTGNFTVPTTPLTAITNTSLLCLQDSRFKDNSSNNFTITCNGDTKVTHFNPFAPPASYTTSAYSGSGYFDGSGDYLTAPNNTAFDFGSGNYTGEAWVYITSNTPSEQHIWGKRANSATAYAPIIFGFSKSGTVYRIYFLGSFTGTSWGINSSFAKGTIDIPLNTWTHVAYVRNGTTFTSFVNGVQDLTFTGLSGSLMTNTDAQAIGASSTIGDTPFFGYISNMRVVKGTAVYTAAFTPPTAPVTAITNTSLLLNATNAGIYDATAINDMETVGNAQVSTTQAKWGASSMYFNGSNSFVKIPQNILLFPGTTGNFTLEFWIYFTNFTSGPVIFDNRLGTYTTNFAIYCNNSGGQTVALYANSADRAISGSLSTATWYHMAVTRSSGTTRFFIAGTQVGSNYTDANNYSSTAYTLGGAFNLSTNVLNGYIEDLRMTNGIARYTANFTPPTAAFPTR